VEGPAFEPCDGSCGRLAMFCKGVAIGVPRPLDIGPAEGFIVGVPYMPFGAAEPPSPGLV